jgi:hypothetical protein
MEQAVELLDRFYAEVLGCLPRDLSAGAPVVVENDLFGVWFAKGAPLAVYALVKPGGAAIVVRPEYRAAVEDMVRRARGLDDATCAAIERAVSPLVDAGAWFRGVRLYCGPESFLDRAEGEAREILPGEDEQASRLHGRWGGKVYGRVMDGKVVSWAAVKPLSSVIWDLSVETLAGYRARGCAKSAVSAALRHVFVNGRLAGWGCDRDSVASLRTAQSVGFQHYCFDFGCVEVPVGESGKMRRANTRKGP